MLSLNHKTTDAFVGIYIIYTHFNLVRYEASNAQLDSSAVLKRSINYKGYVRRNKNIIFYQIMQS